MIFIYCLSDIIGTAITRTMDIAGRDTLRSMPIFLSFFLSLSGLLTAHTFYRNESSGILQKRAGKHTIIGMVTAGILIVFVVIGLITGRYLSITEGAPFPLYPLDTVLYALAYIVMGIFVLRYFRKKAPSEPFAGPSRTPEPGRIRGIRCFFMALWLIGGLYGFCGFFLSIFIVDFSNGYVPYSLAMMLVSLLTCLSIAVWELYYNNLSAKKRKEVIIPLALISLGVSVVAAILYFLALKGNLDGPSNVGFGILPIAFTANNNLSILIVAAMPLIVSVTALIKGLYRKGKEREVYNTVIRS